MSSAAPDLASSTDEVVAWLLGDGHLSCLDETGHPLGEQASLLYARTAGEEELRRFGDARDEAGLPCNVGALAQVRASWPFVLDAVRSFGRGRPQAMRRMLRRAHAGRALAPLRALLAPERPVSSELAALFKATLGFGEILTAALLEERVDADEPPADFDVLAGWLDERPWLIGDAQVCAGSRGQIRALWRALASEEADLDPFSELTGAIDALEELHALAAAAAGAARPHVLAGHSRDATCARLLLATNVPRTAEALRQIPQGGALHPSLLFAAGAVPVSLARFLDALPAAARARRPLERIDGALVASAAPVAARLMQALGRSASALSIEGLRGACAD